MIITGAGAGIGRALAVGFVRAGARVAAISRSAPGLEETRALCSGPGTLDARVADVTDATALEDAFRTVVAARGGVDLLINNAAVYPRADLAAMTPETWSAGVATNLNGVAFGCRAAIRSFPERRAAVILNVGSFAWRGPEPASTLYCATKAAVEAFTRALAVELAARGSPLIVNHWVPGIFRTQMSGNKGEDPSLAFERLLAAWEQSRGAAGGRTFEGGTEVVMTPAPSLRSRVKALLLGRRA
ncbi:MAG TPA: SDR family NAD(P)-dependent oxidoreductase [Steroidobacteraceae bacterium]|nr:SDR family NAD(P)-dependent oxidoreductase [Steroidobacteraceae bacterium]